MFQSLPTPDRSEGQGFTTWVVKAPQNAGLQRAVKGALLSIAYLNTWVQDGTMTPDEASQEIKTMLNSIISADFLIGMITPFITGTIPNEYLLCDGSTYNKDDYPLLWERTPEANRTATTFIVPDLVDRFVMGSDQLDTDQTGGEAEHTLTVDEIPAHTHSYQQYTFGIDIESVGVPDPTGVGQPSLPQTSGSAGGGLAHNNQPPYYKLVYVVLARIWES